MFIRAEGDITGTLTAAQIDVISIHALRAEGDGTNNLYNPITNNISIHALRAEGDKAEASKATQKEISIHALRAEGDLELRAVIENIDLFQSTPSVRRATFATLPLSPSITISIHALRAEGDACFVCF